MEPYIELRFETGEKDELIQAALYDYEPHGVVEEDNVWKIYFTQKMWEEREMTIRIAVEKSAPGTVFLVKPIEQKNWNEEWEKSIEPVHVSGRTVITPSWADYKPAKGETVLVIDPKMSFGTGFHETTRLMLRMMERWVHKGDRALDVGTGTGVLAIAAVKYGASVAVGVDIDEWAEENAGENIERNEVTGSVEIFIGSVERAAGTYDIILSNITRNDNLALLDDYKAKLNDGGRMILSGMYTTDAPSVNEACEALGFSKVDEDTENEWIAAVYEMK